MPFKPFNRILILGCLGLLLGPVRPVFGGTPLIFSDPRLPERSPWQEAAAAGDRRWEEGDEEGAIREWEKAVELGFSEGTVLFRLGRHYALREDWKKAIRYLRPARPRLETAGAEDETILAAAELLALAYLRDRQYIESYLLYLQVLRRAPDSPAGHLGMAQIYLLQGKLDDAEREARRVLELSPGAGQAGRVLAQVAKRRGRYVEAAEYYRLFLAEEPDNWPARLDRGLILAAQLGRDREAERELERVVRDQPDQDRAHAALGEIRLRRGEVAAAAAAAGRALEINPDNYSALTLRGRILLEGGDFAAAEPLFRKALRAEPNGALALYGIGVVLFHRGGYREAESYFRRALDQQPDFPEAALNRGLALDVLGRREEALRLLREAVEKHPEFAPGHLGLGRLYYSSGDLQPALAFFRNALALDPSTWEPYHFIGKCLWDLGRREEARDYYLAARKRGGEAPALLADLARAYEEAGELERAESVLEEALAADARYLPALFQLSLLKSRRGEGEEADRFYRQALVIVPGEASWGFAGEDRDFIFRLVSGLEEYLGAGVDYLSFFALLRNLSRDRKIFAETIPVLREKALARPSSPQYAHLLGLAHDEAGDLESAESYYQQALKIDPDFAAAHLSLGQLYTRTGRPGEARRHLAAVLLLAPRSTVSPEVRQMLENLPE